MDPRLLRREFHQRLDVVDVRVDAAVRYEPEQVHVLPALERRAQRLVLEEAAVLDRTVHAHEILEEDAAGTDGEVADLRVAHLTRRQPDRLARRLQRRVRIGGPEPVEDGCARELDRVPRTRRRASPAVEDHEDYEWIRAPVSHIALNDSASRDAPPTRAPSMSGCESSASALSGFTEPP